MIASTSSPTAGPDGNVGPPVVHASELLHALRDDDVDREERRQANMAHERPTWRDWPTPVDAADPAPARQHDARERCRQHQVSRR